MRDLRQYKKEELREMGYPVDMIRSDKSWLVLFLFWMFGGFIGLHRYYAGRYISGAIYTITFGFLFIGWVLDLLLLLFDAFNDGQGFPIIGNTRKRVRYRTLWEL